MVPIKVIGNVGIASRCQSKK